MKDETTNFHNKNNGLEIGQNDKYQFLGNYYNR